MLHLSSGATNAVAVVNEESSVQWFYSAVASAKWFAPLKLKPFGKEGPLTGTAAHSAIETVLVTIKVSVPTTISHVLVSKSTLTLTSVKTLAAPISTMTNSVEFRSSPKLLPNYRPRSDRVWIVLVVIFGAAYLYAIGRMSFDISRRAKRRTNRLRRVNENNHESADNTSQLREELENLRKQLKAQLQEQKNQSRKDTRQKLEFRRLEGELDCAKNKLIWMVPLIARLEVGESSFKTSNLELEFQIINLKNELRLVTAEKECLEAGHEVTRPSLTRSPRKSSVKSTSTREASSMTTYSSVNIGVQTELDLQSEDTSAASKESIKKIETFEQTLHTAHDTSSEAQNVPKVQPTRATTKSSSRVTDVEKTVDMGEAVVMPSPVAAQSPATQSPTAQSPAKADETKQDVNDQGHDEECSVDTSPPPDDVSRGDMEQQPNEAFPTEVSDKEKASPILFMESEAEQFETEVPANALESSTQSTGDSPNKDLSGSASPVIIQLPQEAGPSSESTLSNTASPETGKRTSKFGYATEESEASSKYSSESECKSFGSWALGPWRQQFKTHDDESDDTEDEDEDATDDKEESAISVMTPWRNSCQAAEVSMLALDITALNITTPVSQVVPMTEEKQSPISLSHRPSAQDALHIASEGLEPTTPLQSSQSATIVESPGDHDTQPVIDSEMDDVVGCSESTNEPTYSIHITKDSEAEACMGFQTGNDIEVEDALRLSSVSTRSIDAEISSTTIEGLTVQPFPIQDVQYLCEESMDGVQQAADDNVPDVEKNVFLYNTPSMDNLQDSLQIPLELPTEPFDLSASPSLVSTNAPVNDQTYDSDASMANFENEMFSIPVTGDDQFSAFPVFPFGVGLSCDFGLPKPAESSIKPDTMFQGDPVFANSISNSAFQARHEEGPVALTKDNGMDGNDPETAFVSIEDAEKYQDVAVSPHDPLDLDSYESYLYNDDERIYKFTGEGESSGYTLSGPLLNEEEQVGEQDLDHSLRVDNSYLWEGLDPQITGTGHTELQTEQPADSTSLLHLQASSSPSYGAYQPAEPVIPAGFEVQPFSEDSTVSDIALANLLQAWTNLDEIYPEVPEGEQGTDYDPFNPGQDLPFSTPQTGGLAADSTFEIPGLVYGPTPDSATHSKYGSRFGEPYRPAIQTETQTVRRGDFFYNDEDYLSPAYPVSSNILGQHTTIPAQYLPEHSWQPIISPEWRAPPTAVADPQTVNPADLHPTLMPAASREPAATQNFGCNIASLLTPLSQLSDHSDSEDESTPQPKPRLILKPKSRRRRSPTAS